MSVNTIYKQYSVIFVDDELQAQKYFSKIFGDTFNILLASDGVEALELFKKHQHEIGLVVTDQRMPNKTGSEFLTEISALNPDVVKILSTAYSDLDAAIDAVNDGGIYRYVTKPWDISELEITLRRAMEYFCLKMQNNALANSKLGGIERIYMQSRLLAAAATPALMEGKVSYITAFKDLLRLSIRDGENAPYLDSISTQLLSYQSRRTLFENLQTQLHEVVKKTKSLAKIADSTVLSKTEGLLKEDPEIFSKALIDLLAGKKDQESASTLSHLLAVYDMDKTLIFVKSGLAFVDAENSNKKTVESELCSLFLDDSLLIGDFLGEVL